MKLWGRKTAFNVQKVMWLLRELDLPHEHVEVGGRFGGLDSPQLLALNPTGRVPILEDGDHVVWESHAVLRYLAAANPQLGSWWCDEVRARSEIDRWMDWAHTSLQPTFMTVFWGFYRTPVAKRDSRMLDREIAELKRVLRLLDNQLERSQFIVGDAITLADIPAGTTLYRLYEMGIDVPRLPFVEAWYAQLQSRRPFREAVMSDFTELKGRTDF